MTILEVHICMTILEVQILTLHLAKCYTGTLLPAFLEFRDVASVPLAHKSSPCQSAELPGRPFLRASTLSVEERNMLEHSA